MKKIILFFIIITTLATTVFATETPNYTFETLRGEVLVADEPYDANDEMNGRYQNLKVYINDNSYKATVPVTASLTYFKDTTNYSNPYKAGDKIYLYTTFEDGKIVDAEVVYRDSTTYIVLMAILFVTAVVLVGGFKGLKSIIGLIVTIALIFLVLIPGITSGKNPLLLTILISIATIVSTFIIIGGIKKKSVAAMIGTTGGIILAGAFAVLFGHLMDLSGMCEETGMITILSESARGFDYRGILFSGIIIGALGACMDVGMSIASALWELKEENPDITKKRMMKAGMNIGRDMIGTMTNTLILAYVGGAILTILLQVLGGLDFIKIINQEIIAEEIVRSLAGSIGLILTIPLTTAVCAMMMGKKE